jgi:phage terminase large subunit
MEKQNANNSSHNFEVAKFIGNQHLTDIREIKNHQRNITFQYILIAIAISGLTKIEQIEICHFWIKTIIVAFGIIVIGFILQFQRSLSNSRRKIKNIWLEPYFKHAFEKELLNVDKNDPEKYTSPLYQWQYPVVYILLVIMVMISLLLIL